MADVDAGELLSTPVPETMSRIFFIRDESQDPVESSINVAVNDRFLESLQPGNFIHTLTCSGTNQLSTVVTGQKTNDLLRNISAYQLVDGQTYFFRVYLDAEGRANLTPLSHEEGLHLLQDKMLQGHQVNRIVPQCITGNTPPLIANLKVYFVTNEYNVSPSYYPEIKRVAEFMNQYPSIVVRIEGHTDNRASAAYNKALSQHRAEAVRDVLVNQFGINPNRLQAVGYGDTQPIVSNTTEEGRKLNRRVLAVIQSR